MRWAICSSRVVTRLCSSSCLAIFFKTLGCAVQAVAPTARICDLPSVKVRQILPAPWLIPVIHVLNSRWYEGFRIISIEFSPVVTLPTVDLVIPSLAWRLCFIQRKRERLNPVGGELADMRLAFLLCEETAAAESPK